MRHLLSVVLSIILAPLIYVAAGFAAIKLGEAHLGVDIDWTAAEIGLAAGVVAGALYAVLVMARISPAGPLIAGLLYLGVTLWAFLDQASFVKAFDLNLIGEHHVLLQPVGAGTLLLAVPLIATVFSRRRWATASTPGLPYDAAPAYAPAPLSAAPSYGEPEVATPAYGAPYPGEPAVTYPPTSPGPTSAEPTTAYQPAVSSEPQAQPYAASPYVPPQYQTGTGSAPPAAPAVDEARFESWTPYTPEERTSSE